VVGSKLPLSEEILDIVTKPNFNWTDGVQMKKVRKSSAKEVVTVFTILIIVTVHHKKGIFYYVIGGCGPNEFVGVVCY